MKAYGKYDINYKQAHVAEVLSKTVAYLHPSVLENQSIKLPVDGELVRYTIKTHVMDPSRLPFLTLTPDAPTKAEPWLIIRGTDANVIGRSAHKDARENALQSIMADFIDPKGIANGPIDQALDQFVSCMQELSGDSQKKVNLAGHSLGGEYVQHLAVRLEGKRQTTDPNLKIGTVSGFNSPGVPKYTKQLYEALRGKDTLKMHNFNKAGDPVSSAGRALIGQHFRIKGDEDASPDVAHRECDLHRHHTLETVNVKAEESKGARRLSEGLRKHLAGTALRAALHIKAWLGKKRSLPGLSATYNKYFSLYPL